MGKPGQHRRGRGRGKNSDGIVVQRTPELAARIAHALVEADGGLDKLPELDPSLPVGKLIRRWATEDPEFRSLLDRAREGQWERLIYKAWEAMKEFAYDATQPPEVNRVVADITYKKFQATVKTAQLLAAKRFGNQLMGAGPTDEKLASQIQGIENRVARLAQESEARTIEGERVG